MQALSFRQHGIELSAAQANALGRRNGVRLQWFVDGDVTCLSNLQAALDAQLPAFPGGAFVKLGSRCSKDTPLGLLTGCRARTGSEVLRLLSDGSQRIAYDLHAALQQGILPWVFLREWRDIPWAAELRCFQEAGQLVGISQYHFRNPMSPHDRVRAYGSRPAIERMSGTLSAEMGAVSLVFDVCVDDAAAGPDGSGDKAAVRASTVTLIELNPWGHPTQACLFDWRDQFDHSLRLA